MVHWRGVNTPPTPSPTVASRLLAQLEETENALEQFWSRHHLKLEQCLQLRHFEQDFREVGSRRGRGRGGNGGLLTGLLPPR